jgi:hypothetical protein
MQKISTSPKKTDLYTEKKNPEVIFPLQPSEASIQKIMKFASTYRAQKVKENQFVEWLLN